jgi:hypothetical protein
VNDVPMVDPDDLVEVRPGEPFVRLNDVPASDEDAFWELHLRKARLWAEFTLLGQTTAGYAALSAPKPRAEFKRLFDAATDHPHLVAVAYLEDALRVLREACE